MKWVDWKKEVFHLMKTKYSRYYGKYLLSRYVDWNAWREYYENDHSPDNAISTEISYGD